MVLFEFKKVFAEPVGLGLKVLLVRSLHIQFLIERGLISALSGGAFKMSFPKPELKKKKLL